MTMSLEDKNEAAETETTEIGETAAEEAAEAETGEDEAEAGEE
jgi:hypothetical protein